MTASIADRARGLVDGNELAEAPGALTTAENVVVEPGGALAVRPTFVLGDANVANEKGRTCVALGDIPGVIKLQSDGTTDRLWMDGVDITGALEPPSGVDEHPWCNGRGSLYIESNLGLRKWDGAAASVVDAGLNPDIVFNRLYIMLSISGVGDEAAPWVGQVAYRLCVKRTDANGYVRRSRPTSRFATTTGNLIGGQTAGLLGGDRYYIRGIEAGDVIEWYRTRDSGAPTVPPASSHYLVCEYTITATDVSNGYFYNTTKTFDTTPDDELGAALYTNPERDGIAKAKEIPPIARTIAPFARCTWYGDTTSRERVVGALTAVGHVLDFEGTVTIGTNTITAVPSTAGLRVGMFVCDSNNIPSIAGTYFAARTRITAISGPGPGATVTVSANASASAAPVYCGACNWIDPSMIARYAVGVSLTSGLSTITVRNATGVKEGMYIWEQTSDTPFTAGTYVDASTRVVSVGGVYPTVTITIDKPLIGTVGAISLRIGDYVTIDGVDYVATPAGVGYGPGTTFGARTRTWAITGADTVGTSIQWLAQAVNFDALVANRGWRMIVTGTEGEYGRLTSGDFVIEERGIGGAGFDLEGNVDAYGVYAWSPSLIESIASSNDRATNRLFWSAPEEPEAVPLINFVDVATSSAKIQRVIPLRAALLVFTTEGLYRVAGVAPDAWSVDLIDPTIRLVSRDTVDVIDNQAIAWTTRGVMLVNEGEAVDISTGAIGKRLDAYVRDGAGTTSHVWVAAWRSQHLALVGCGTDTNNGESTEVFAFNTLSRAWTSWPIRYRDALEVDGRIRLVRGDRFTIAESRAVAPLSVGYDLSWSISAWTYTAPTTSNPPIITIATANLGGWRPRVGDYFRATVSGSPVWRRIADFAIDGSDHEFIISRPITGTITALTAYEVATADLEWTPATAGSLQGFHQRWREGCVTLDVSGYDGDGISTTTQAHEIEPAFGATTSMVAQRAERKLVSVVNSKTLPLRFAVIRMLSRASILWPVFKGAAIGWPMRIYGVTMQRLPASEKVHR